MTKHLLRAPRLAAWLLAPALAAACAGSTAPRNAGEGGFLARTVEQTRDGIRVRAAVPSAEETRALFGVPLYAKGVQPVWLEVANHRDERISFLPVGLDPEYFTPVEAANLDLVAGKGEANPLLSRRFLSDRIQIFINPGASESGFVFTTLDEGTKAFNVDVVSDSGFFGFSFFIPVPGLRIDHHEVDWANLYPAEEILELDAAALIAALEQSPCCTTDKRARDPGDPLNLVVIGDQGDVYQAFLRAGWDETETIHRASLWKTLRSFFTGSEYRYSPVSGLYVFGRPQDVAFQKARDNIHERNHLRLWMSPLRFEGKPVWLGQISRDIGVRFTRRTITTHKIDPDVDETREFLLEDLAYAQSLAGFGYVRGVGAAPLSSPRHNLTGDPYFSDGYRVVLWVSADPVDIADVEFVSWARLGTARQEVPRAAAE